MAPDEGFDLARPRRIHIVGIGGAGMSAIASVLVAQGHQVTGSDLKRSAAFDRLAAAGIEVVIGHDGAHVGDAEVVAISTAIADRNPEVRAARERDIPVLRRAELLGAIAAHRRTIAVAGTHGKTTTASMLALVLIEAGLEPSFVIGGDVNEIGTGAVWGPGEWFVVEADESDGSFLSLGPELTVTTNVEPDHLEHYGSWEALHDAFDRFVGETLGPKVVCADDEVAAALGRAHGAVSYGTSETADYQMRDLTTTRVGCSFTLHHGGEQIVGVHLPIPGAHNARNAAGALVTGLLVGVDPAAGEAALARFAGVARRFEFRGETAGVSFIDDYAHLPTEVEAALAAARDGGWDRVVCVFQPHRYSRMSALAGDFGDSFGAAEVLVVTDIYSAGEAPRPGVSGKLLANAVLDADPWRRLAYLPRRRDWVPYLVRELRPGDLCLTLGAGDLTSLPDETQAALAAQ